ncbi:uncharacterized protein LOC129615952 isoform X2 [Condylostylus longicornis]|uniref:uncharacterized protein LOC129615952 isoform X2 n=1 Tax=Condylostylus longicornis TaxID=2530218 RepID=UPI00244E2A72|nr:uncharacterized protein LOC129615952 isoform X2 [Condylostylus longicornis]
MKFSEVLHILPDILLDNLINSGPLSEAQTAVGLEVSMPCDLTPGNTIPDTTDKVTLVIWYKEGLVKPIYSFDARGKPYQDASHWQDPQILKQKARFYYDSNPPALRIRDVQREDAGLYRCRVDFHRSPTRNWRINVTVLVPPKTLTILDTYGAAVTENVVGPYDEGANINLTCISSGGIPPPRVSWWKEHALLDDGYQVLPDGTVRNILHLSNISRKDLMTVFTCQATNGHVVAPLSNAVKLDMNLPPLYVRLQGLNHPLAAGVRTQITCTSAGARPPPQIVWNKGGIIMRGATQSTSQDGNVTVSELVFIPVPEDNEKQIICSVTSDFQNQWNVGGIDKMNHLDNNVAAAIFLKDSRTLDVKHAPIVSLNLGAPLDPSNLMKGSDVYLECDIKSNPPAKKVEWYHNDKQLHSSRGIIISNQTLVLQGISKITHGQYFCRASNIQGTVSSNEVYLDVKYPPVCRTDSTIIRAALKQIVNITCDVDSNPQNNLSYKWSFNNSLESIIELPPILRYSNRILSSSDNINDIGLPDSEDMLDDDSNTYLDEKQMMEQHDKIGPKSQMVYSNLVHQQQLDKLRKQQQQQQHFQLYQNQQRSKAYQMNHNYHNTANNNNNMDQDKFNKNNQNSYNLENLYRYRVESFTHFGTVSCIASNTVGQSQPCLYHITPAELPDPVKNCTAYNATANSIHLVCIPGNDGGIQQHFHVEVYDELNRQILYNTSYKYPEFTIKRLPSDSVFVIRVMAYNLQGFSNRAYRLRAKTLSAPLLRTAVLVQLTPLLGALVGIVITLILVSTCVVLIIKFRTKNHNRRPRNHSRNDTTTTEADKGSAEPLSRNMGSHSSLEDKNPDVIPQENSEDEYHLEEKVFNRMDFDSKRNLYTTPRLNSTSPTPLSPTFAKQYGELSLTTNPSYALYNSPQRPPATQRPVYTDPPELSSPRSQCNIYTKVPSKTSFLQTATYDTRLASPTSPFEQTTIPSIGTGPTQQTTIPCTYSSLSRQTKPTSNYKSLTLNVPTSATLSKGFKNGTNNIVGGNNISNMISSTGPKGIITTSTPVSTQSTAAILKSPYQMSTTTTLLIDKADSILGNYEENS